MYRISIICIICMSELFPTFRLAMMIARGRHFYGLKKDIPNISIIFSAYRLYLLYVRRHIPQHSIWPLYSIGSVVFTDPGNIYRLDRLYLSNIDYMYYMYVANSLTLHLPRSSYDGAIFTGHGNVGRLYRLYVSHIEYMYYIYSDACPDMSAFHHTRLGA